MINHNHSDANKIRIISHNCARSQNVMLSILHTALLTADIALIQEPWIRKDRETGHQSTVSHPSFQSIIPPSIDNRRARVVAFISTTNPHLRTTSRPDLCNDPDLMILEVKTGSIPPTFLANIYNETLPEGAQRNHQYTVERELVRLDLPTRTIVTGDFNAHHPWWNSFKPPIRSEHLVQWAEDKAFSLLNEPDVSTYSSRSS